MLQATNIPYMSNAATVMAQQLRSAGMKVDLQPMDWANVVQRRASQNPPDQGGWNIFFTSADGPSNSNPYTMLQLATVGTKGWFGWPTDEKNEQLRARVARRRNRAGAQVHRRARSRKMPGISCRICISASGSSRRRIARTSRAGCTRPDCWHSGTSRRHDGTRRSPPDRAGPRSPHEQQVKMVASPLSADAPLRVFGSVHC